MVYYFRMGEKLIATNRQAWYHYHILDEFEAGLVLKGAEVKALREAKASLSDSFARVENEEILLYNLHISLYSKSSEKEYNPTRPRKLLLHKKEIDKLTGKLAEKGLSLIPLKIYFKRGIAKVKIALAKGKKLYDKRETLKRKTAEKELRRAVKSSR